MIIIDEREFALISLFKEKETKLKTSVLEVGDILIVPSSPKKYGKGGIIIERKEIDHDFFSSIYDGRLHAQIRAMINVAKNREREEHVPYRLILLLEGDFDGHQKKDEMLDIIYSFCIFKNIHPLFTKSLKKTYKTILKLNEIYFRTLLKRKKKQDKKITEEEKEKIKELREIIREYGIEQKKKFKTKEATFLRMMMEIPNISTETAIAIGLFCDCKFENLIKKKNKLENIKIPTTGHNISQNAVKSLSEILFGH